MTPRPTLRSRLLVLVTLLFAVIFLQGTAALAAEPVEVSRGDVAIDLTNNVDIYDNQGETFQVSTAPDPNGIRRRIEVRATNGNHLGDWAVFSLANVSDEQIDRVIVAPHFRLPGSRLFWPDLGSERVVAITPSEGFTLERQDSDDADVFRITLNPGSVVTFVAELASPTLPQLYLWQPDEYKDTENAFTLYHGIVLGIAGLLAVFLTILFVVKGTSMLPATAMLAWSVLLYVAIDFSFLEKLIPLTPTDERIWRASADVAVAFSLVVFLFTYLNLSRWHVHLGYATAAWGLAVMALFGVAIFDPSVATGIARISFATTVALGTMLIIYLSARRYDRAILLMPAWALIIAWLFAGWLTVTGRIDNDIVQPALDGGLVLIVLLLGFTVMQHAFAGGAYQSGLFSDLERQALALIGADGTVWDWDVARDRIVTEPDFSTKLGLTAGMLSGPARSWLPLLHPDDRDMFRSTLDMLLEWRRGRLKLEFRIRADDGHYHWLLIRARPVLSANGEVVRCVGTLTDLTEFKASSQRLLQDAVQDNLTGLVNRPVFLDRLKSVMTISDSVSSLQPTVIVADIDRYSDINDTLGIAAGDNILIALTRRMQRLMKPEDTLARLSGNSFAIILLSENDPVRIAEFTDGLTAAIAMPVYFGERDIQLTASIGIASWHDEHEDAESFLEDARLAMYRAKRAGGNRVETFKPSFRMFGAERLQIKTDLGHAIERSEMNVLYRPIVRLDSFAVAGFECQLRWQHPRRGEIAAGEVETMAAEAGLMPDLILFTLKQALADLAAIQGAIPGARAFVSIDLATKDMLRTSTLNEIESMVRRSGLSPRQLMLTMPENIILEAPEQARRSLEQLRAIGIGLGLDRFGNGYGSLSFLNGFPFDFVRVDHGLFDRETEDSYELTRAFVELAEKMGIRVSILDVKTETQARGLSDAGCAFAQGPLYGPAVRASQALRLLRDRDSYHAAE
ncbi:EAL domain-containing protein [Martelella alba]|uniref:EAL domain-containing protein n=1 Tax=Martelella alba TaxID=2590451 RepID=A0A506UD30_9HYPH|nr:EAL domain-containing protein [Martelella alba]TPW31508.1 EAL domain-containing protein [Martelella alba]